MSHGLSVQHAYGQGFLHNYLHVFVFCLSVCHCRRSLTMSDCSGGVYYANLVYETRASFLFFVWLTPRSLVPVDLCQKPLLDISCSVPDTFPRKDREIVSVWEKATWHYLHRFGLMWRWVASSTRVPGFCVAINVCHICWMEKSMRSVGSFQIITDQSCLWVNLEVVRCNQRVNLFAWSVASWGRCS